MFYFRLGKLSQIVNDQLSPNVSKFIMFVEVYIQKLILCPKIQIIIVIVYILA